MKAAPCFGTESVSSHSFGHLLFIYLSWEILGGQDHECDEDDSNLVHRKFAVDLRLQDMLKEKKMLLKISRK